MCQDIMNRMEGERLFDFRIRSEENMEREDYIDQSSKQIIGFPTSWTWRLSL